ncbi:MAG: hypothetical protein R3C59_21375 [Planctomycetaceae bacterium]
MKLQQFRRRIFNVVRRWIGKLGGDRAAQADACFLDHFDLGFLLACSVIRHGASIDVGSWLTWFSQICT